MNTPRKAKLSDLGTTGLIDYVVSTSGQGARAWAFAKGRAINVLRRRGYEEGAVERFKRAVYVVRDQREARQRAGGI